MVTPLSSATENAVYPMPLFFERTEHLDNFDFVADQVVVALAAIFALGCLVLVTLFLKWRTTPQVKSSTLEFCLLILIGAVSAYVSLFFQTLTLNDTFCRLHPWLLVLGLDSIIIPLLIKNVRIYRIFKAAEQLDSNARCLSVGGLFATYFGLLAFVVVVLIVWTAGWTPVALIISDDPLRPYYNRYTCTSPSNADTVFIGILGAYQAVLLLAGIVLTFLLRKVPSEFNEAKYITYAIYNSFFCLIVLFVIWMAIPSSDFALAFIARSVVLLWAITISVLVIFIPKVPPLRHLIFISSS